MAEDARALAELASELLLARIADAISARKAARIILAGGNTPKETYALLASGITGRKIPPRDLGWFLGDERWVGRDDPQSNEGMARAALLDRIGAPDESLHSWNAGIGDPVACARLYGETISRSLGDAPPDLLILGLGADGHTASLFPGAVAHLPGGARVPVGPAMPAIAAAVQAGAGKGWRLTLCPALLRRSRCVVFLVAGADKADALRRVRSGDPATPGSWVRGESTFYVATRDAAGRELPQYGPDVRHA